MTNAVLETERLVKALGACGLAATLDLTASDGTYRISVEISRLFRGAGDPLLLVSVSETHHASGNDHSDALADFLTREMRLADNSLAVILHSDTTRLALPQECSWVPCDAAEFAQGLRGTKGEEFLRAFIGSRFGLKRLNPYQSTRAVAHKMFFGRSHELSTLLNLGDSYSNHVVVGPRRGGKTSLALQVWRRLRTDPDMRLSFGAVGGVDRYLYSVSYVDTQKLVDFDDLWDEILRNMGLEQRDTVGGVRKEFKLRLGRELVDKPDYELLADLLQVKYRRSLLLLDEVDRFLESDAEKRWPIVNKLRALVDNPIAKTKVVLLGYDRLYKFAKSGDFPLYGRFDIMRLANLERDGAEELIQGPMKELGVEIHDKDVGQIVGRINRATGGLPHLIQDVCRQIVDRLAAEGGHRLTPKLVGDLLDTQGPRLIERVYSAFTELPNPLARLIAYLVANMERAVSFQGIFDLLSTVHGLKTGDVVVRDALDYLYLHNVLHCSDPKGEYWFASELFKRRLRGELQVDSAAIFLSSLVERATNYITLREQ